MWRKLNIKNYRPPRYKRLVSPHGTAAAAAAALTDIMTRVIKK